MKKILLSLMALACSMSMNAQIKGTATRTGDISVNWVQLWEDGPRFAEYNVGAENAEDYGGYYCWGRSINRDSNGEYKSGTDALSGTDDTATNLWGENWRMPTKEELQALIANCDVEWTDNYNESGIKGKVFTGKGVYASNSVFVPANGLGLWGSVIGKGNEGQYWSSTPDGTTRACYLSFNSAVQRVENDSRQGTRAVRAVLADNAAAIEGVVDNAINTRRGGKKVIDGSKLIIIGNNGKMYNTVGIEIKK